MRTVDVGIFVGKDVLRARSVTERCVRSPNRRVRRPNAVFGDQTGIAVHPIANIEYFQLNEVESQSQVQVEFAPPHLHVFVIQVSIALYTINVPVLLGVKAIVWLCVD